MSIFCLEALAYKQLKRLFPEKKDFFYYLGRLKKTYGTTTVAFSYLDNILKGVRMHSPQVSENMGVK